jgi:hypothetical protein
MVVTAKTNLSNKKRLKMAKSDFDIFFEHPEQDSFLKMLKEEREFYQKAFSNVVTEIEAEGYTKGEIKDILEEDNDFRSVKSSLSRAKRKKDEHSIVQAEANYLRVAVAILRGELFRMR